MEPDTCIVSCETLKQELEAVMKRRHCEYPVIWIDSGKHAWPDKLRIAVQEAIDGVSPSYKTVLLLFGFCGNALVGIEARNSRLVLPKAADCIPLFIGSREEREAYGTGTYFFTGGYLNSGGSIASDTNRVFQRYGEKRGLSILKKMIGHYRDFAVIDTGTFNVPEVKATVERFAQLVEIPVKVIPGNLRFIDALLADAWPEDSFLTVKPGEKITFEDSLNAGRAQDAAGGGGEW
ncbi:MAG: DUF1638 domain-containing protein [Treponema sp.]|jgi:hypothetical protein|nr:DUF1638 domain-containing protein [Treponema sp.]